MSDPQNDEDVPTPWSFKIMVVLVTIYLGYRLVQIIGWVWDHLT